MLRKRKIFIIDLFREGWSNEELHQILNVPYYSTISGSWSTDMQLLIKNDQCRFALLACFLKLMFQLAPFLYFPPDGLKGLIG